MKLLLDTHIFLWFISADERLPLPWKEAILNPDNAIKGYPVQCLPLWLSNN
jgi:PIN domain nuclease of toxin-antitoxin system